MQRLARNHHPRARLALCLLLGGGPGSAMACTNMLAPQWVDGTVEAANADPAGQHLGLVPWSGNAFAFTDCTGRQPINVEVAFSGLSYVQDVQLDGMTFSAYAFSATSPLVIFAHYSGHSRGRHGIPLALGHNLDPNTPTSPTVPEVYRSQVLAYVVARGGVMTSVPYTLVGSVTTSPVNFPAVSRTVPVSIGINVLAPTCALSNASLVLDDLPADRLPAVGDAAGEKPLEVAMRCPGGGIAVALSLTDAHDPGNTGSALSPTVDSDARGVRIQLLRNALPVQFGQSWDHGLSVGGEEKLPFSVRYQRVATDVEAGEIKGEAVLSATYR